MASKNIVAGVFDQLYIGNYGASGTPLTNIGVQLDTTGAYRLRETTPRGEFVYATGSYEQDGDRTVTITIAFMSDDPIAVKLARGLPLSATYQDQESTNQQYVLLLVDSIHDEDSILIPRCESLCDLSYERSKNNQTEVGLTFRYQTPEMATQLFYKRGNAALDTILDATSQSPL